jgi:hypothetical protein
MLLWPARLAVREFDPNARAPAAGGQIDGGRADSGPKPGDSGARGSAPGGPGPNDAKPAPAKLEAAKPHTAKSEAPKPDIFKSVIPDAGHKNRKAAKSGGKKSDGRKSGSPEPGEKKADSEHLFSQVDKIVAALGKANIAYNLPPTMQIDDTAPIELLLSPRETISELRQKLSNLGKTEGASIAVAEVMEASLYGRGFDTHELTPARQAVSETAETEWRWEITAKQPGLQELRLTISAVLEVDGHEAPRVLQVYERSIEVDVTVGRRISKFLTDYWQWVLGVVFSPFVFGIGRTFFRRARSKPGRDRWAGISSSGQVPGQPGEGSPGADR